MSENIVKKAIDSGIAPFAVTTFRNKERVFGIKVDDRRRHVYVLGKTGMGKTTLIENMVYSDIMAGHGVCYIDPHGDTAEKMLSWIPNWRINDVIYFNPADLEFPISFNVLEKVDPKNKHLVSSGLIGVFKKLWADSWGPRLEYILRNAILGLLEYPDSTLLGINRILVDKNYRKKVVEKIQDPVVRSFWVDEFPKWNERVLQEVVSPIQNKVGQFLSTALIRNVIGQVKSSVNLRQVMDEGKIIIFNLSKGRIGEDASALFGAMMVTKIQLAAMSRVDILEKERNDFYLYVDEFQNFVTDSFADILSEARKYHLNLIIAHQYIEQLGEVVQPAVFGNVGTMIVFRIGAADAEFLESEFSPQLTQEDLVNLPKYHIFLKLMIDGVTSEPFSAKGLPPIYSESFGNEEKVIRASRERYAKPREVVEDKIRRWAESKGGDDEIRKMNREVQDAVNKKIATVPKDGVATTIPKSSVSSIVVSPAVGDGKNNKKKKKEKKQGPGFPATCFGCQRQIEVSFQPDNVRPVYCKDCLKKARRGEIKIKQAQPVEKNEVKSQTAIRSISLNELGKQTVDFKGKPLGVKLPANINQPSQPIMAKIIPKAVTPPQAVISTSTPIKVVTQPPVAPKPVPVSSQPSVNVKAPESKPAIVRPESAKVEVTPAKPFQPVAVAKTILPQVDLLNEALKSLEEEKNSSQPAKSVNLLNPQSADTEKEKSVNQGQIIEL